MGLLAPYPRQHCMLHRVRNCVSQFGIEIKKICTCIEAIFYGLFYFSYYVYPSKYICFLYILQEINSTRR